VSSPRVGSEISPALKEGKKGSQREVEGHLERLDSKEEREVGKIYEAGHERGTQGQRPRGNAACKQGKKKGAARECPLVLSPSSPLRNELRQRTRHTKVAAKAEQRCDGDCRRPHSITIDANKRHEDRLRDHRDDYPHNR